MDTTPFCSPSAPIRRTSRSRIWPLISSSFDFPAVAIMNAPPNKIHSVAIFGIENAAAHILDSRAKFHTKPQSAQRTDALGYSSGILTPQGERGTGRSCFLYSAILPRSARPVKHFLCVLWKKYDFPANGTHKLPFYPFRHRLRRCHLPQGDGFRSGGKVQGTAKRRPLGEAGCE